MQPLCTTFNPEDGTGCDPEKPCTEATCPFIAFFCRDCALYKTCGYKRLPKITRTNLYAINEWHLTRLLPAYLPQPFTAKLREQFLIISGEIEAVRKSKEQAAERRLRE